jgi:hypothetical protein
LLKQVIEQDARPLTGLKSGWTGSRAVEGPYRSLSGLSPKRVQVEGLRILYLSAQTKLSRWSTGAIEQMFTRFLRRHIGRCRLSVLSSLQSFDLLGTERIRHHKARISQEAYERNKQKTRRYSHTCSFLDGGHRSY